MQQTAYLMLTTSHLWVSDGDISRTYGITREHILLGSVNVESGKASTIVVGEGKRI
jgi:hypothetical protein